MLHNHLLRPLVGARSCRTAHAYGLVPVAPVESSSRCDAEDARDLSRQAQTGLDRNRELVAFRSAARVLGPIGSLPVVTNYQWVVRATNVTQSGRAHGTL